MADTGITVWGRGRRTHPPDAVLATIGVSMLRTTMAAARQDATDAARQLQDRLREHGVEDRHVQTAETSIHPEWDHTGTRPVRVGYRVTSTLRVRLEDLAGASAVLDSVADAGGDDLVLNDVRFVLDESVERTAEVRADAWEDAHRRASHLAELAGRRLGAAVQIEEMDADPGPGPRPMRAMAAEAMPALAGGELELSCVLKVRFELAN